MIGNLDQNQASENHESEFAFWLEHAPKEDPGVLRGLVEHSAADIVWLMGVLLDLYSLSHDKTLAVLQIYARIFQRAWKELDRFRGQDSLRNWLFKLTIEEMDRYNRRDRLSLKLTSNQSKELLWLYVPENDLANIQEQIDLGTLDHREQLTLFLRYASNLDASEIAQVMGISEQKTHKLLYKAREKIGFKLTDRKSPLGNSDIHTRAQHHMDARLDGHTSIAVGKSASIDSHLLSCPQCMAYTALREQLDENLMLAFRRRWPKKNLVQHLPQRIYQLAVQKAAYDKSPLPYRTRFTEAKLIISVLAIMGVVGIYFNNQDIDRGAMLIRPTAGPTPTSPLVNDAPERSIPELESSISVVNEFINYADPVLSRDSQKLVSVQTDESISVNCLAISPGDDLLVTGSSNGRVNLWSVQSERLLLTLHGHTLPVDSVAFSPDGSKFVSGSHDGNIILWRTLDGAVLAELSSYTGAVLGVTFSPDGGYLAVGAVDAAWVWELSTGQYNLIDYYPYPQERVHDVAFSSDGSLLAHAVSDGSVWIRRLSDRKLITRLAGHEDEVLSVSFSSQDTYLASGSKDGIVNLWQIDWRSQSTPQFSRLLKLHHTNWVNDLAFSPDERFLAVAAYRSQIPVWIIPGGELRGTSLGSRWNRPKSVAFSSDGRFLAAGSLMGGIQIWIDIQY